MKRLFIMLTLVGSSFFTTAFATDKNTSPVVVQSFKTSFYDAEEVTWEQVGVFYKASFVLDGQHRAAFYTGEGELVATTENIAASKLPKALQASLKKELQGRWMTNLFIVSIEGNKTYYVALENADTMFMLKSAGAKKWVTYQKAVK